MINRLGLLRHHASRLVAIAIIAGLYNFARLPQLPADEQAALRSRFAFTRAVLPNLPGQVSRSIRSVHPSLAGHAAWISSVGAAVALHDLDGDGLPNDLCYVDTRTDQVIVAPVPGTPSRYQPFALAPAPLPYDAATMAPMGCLPGDFNEDGLADILVYYWGRTPIIFLRKQDHIEGASRLAASDYVRRELVPGTQRWYTNAATQADLDGDGHIDLIIGNYFPDGAHILDAHGSGLETMQHSMSRAYNGGEKHLLLWAGATNGLQPAVQFREAHGVLDDEVNHGWTLAVGAADLDGDLRPELYFANDFGPDRLLHNLSTPGHLRFTRLEGEKTLMSPNSKVLGHDSFKGMGVDFGDLNGDGLLDIFVSNIAATYSLEESHFAFLSTRQIARMRDGVAPYVDRSESLGLSRSGWGWDAKFGDFDNAGSLEVVQATGFVKGTTNRWPELHELAMGNDELLSDPRSWPRVKADDDLSGHEHPALFVRAANGRYYDLAPELGLDDPQVSRGIATADVDGDGRLDFAVAGQWEPSVFYHNVNAHAGAFLGLHLLLPVAASPSTRLSVRAGHPGADMAGRPAIGAAATVHLPDGRRLVAQVDGGNGHSGKRSPDLSFGLGQLAPDTRLQIDLAWRDGQGSAHRQTVQLTPGWHTILLGG